MHYINDRSMRKSRTDPVRQPRIVNLYLYTIYIHIYTVFLCGKISNKRLKKVLHYKVILTYDFRTFTKIHVIFPCTYSLN